MKKTFFLFLLLPFYLNGQTHNFSLEELYAQVSGNSVFLSQSMALRNCGAVYDMHVILLGDTMYWYQVDTGSTAVCLCSFNLSVTVDSIPTGHYTAKVYLTFCPDCPPPGADTGYVGSVEFDIIELNSNMSMSVIDQNQSDCFPYNGIDDGKARILPYSIFPNPIQNYLHITTTDLGEKQIRIFDLQGSSLYESTFTDEKLDIDLRHYGSGLYMLVYSNNRTNYHSKFYKVN
jgi:hypothetical protein